jgi:hypothetical protein
MSEVNKTTKSRIGNKLRKEIDLSLVKIEVIIRHIKNVQDNCLLMGKRLIESGQIDLGRMLIARGLTHDNSKFFGAEWDNMIPIQSINEDKEKSKLKLAIRHHNSTNLHHPESWPKGIGEMPDLFLAEMVCDIKSRSEEFGTSLIEWIDETATKKFNFQKTDEVYNRIIKFVNLLCEKPFEQITEQ